MTKFSNNEVVDIITYDNYSAILVEKSPIPGQFNRYKVNYCVYDFETGEKEPITKGAYLLKKFGSAYRKISESVSNVVSCEAAVLYDRRVLMIYPNGEAGIFDREGELTWSGNFDYHEQKVSGLALEGKYFWSICPSENCIIRYSCQNMKVDLRIGGKEATTFINPTDISFEDGDIYVCCDTNKIKKVDGVNYSVSNYLESKEPIIKFQKFKDNGILCLQSGTYII